MSQLHGLELRIIGIVRCLDRATDGVDAIHDSTTNHPPHRQACRLVGTALTGALHSGSDADIGAGQAHVLGADQIARHHCQIPASGEGHIPLARTDRTARQCRLVRLTVMTLATDRQVLVARNVVNAQLVGGQHTCQIAIFLLVHLGTTEGVLSRIDD